MGLLVGWCGSSVPCALFGCSEIDGKLVLVPCNFLFFIF